MGITYHRCPWCKKQRSVLSGKHNTGRRGKERRWVHLRPGMGKACWKCAARIDWFKSWRG